MIIGTLLIPLLGLYCVAVTRIICRFNDEHALLGRFGAAEQDRRITKQADILVRRLEQLLQRAASAKEFE